jgi:hypothetical protein
LCAAVNVMSSQVEREISDGQFFLHGQHLGFKLLIFLSASAGGTVHFSFEPGCSPLTASNAEAKKAVRNVRNPGRECQWVVILRSAKNSDA